MYRRSQWRASDSAPLWHRKTWPIARRPRPAPNPPPSAGATFATRTGAQATTDSGTTKGLITAFGLPDTVLNSFGS